MTAAGRHMLQHLPETCIIAMSKSMTYVCDWTWLTERLSQLKCNYRLSAIWLQAKLVRGGLNNQLINAQQICQHIAFCEAGRSEERIRPTAVSQSSTPRLHMSPACMSPAQLNTCAHLCEVKPLVWMVSRVLCSRVAGAILIASRAETQSTVSVTDIRKSVIRASDANRSSRKRNGQAYTN